jgi:phospholipid transport system transporter-binding protein
MASTAVLPVALPAVLTQAQAQSVADALVKTLLANVAQGAQAVIDASALTQFDSSALAVVLACRRAVLAQGGQLQVLGLPDRAQALARVYGVADLLG